MDDKTWEKILTYIFKVERLCLKQLWIKPEDKRFIRIDLPTIAIELRNYLILHINKILIIYRKVSSK